MNLKKLASDLKTFKPLSKEFGFVYSLKYLTYKYTHQTRKYIDNARRVLEPYVERAMRDYGGAHPVNDTTTGTVRKVPVWMFWWQGVNQMPEVCRICYESLRRNLPDEAELILLTKDNYPEYASIPDEIVSKIEKGVYSLTLFSDLLRNELLVHHGGLWVDSTMYCSKPITPQDLDLQHFWSIKLQPSIADNNSIGRSITNRMWGGFIQRAPKGSKINVIVLNALKQYMSEHNVLSEYFIQNIFIRLLYDKDADVRQEIDSIEFSNPNLYDLDSMMNEPFDQEKWDQLIENTTFFKLSWKKKYSLTTSDGRDSFYGYLLKKNN